MPKKGKKGGKKGKGKKASDEGPQVQGAPSCSVPVSATVARSRVHDGHATARTRTRPACARRGQSTGEHASQADSQRVAVLFVETQIDGAKGGKVGATRMGRTYEFVVCSSPSTIPAASHLPEAAGVS